VSKKEAIRIEGLNEFRRSLKALDNDLPKVLRMAFNDAADLVTSDAQPRVPRRGGRARGSVKSKSTQTSARVIGGGRRAPYYPWLDFGGRVGPRKSIRRPFIKRTGRYIYKSYFAHKDSGDMQQALSHALIKVADQAGLEVT
jgi:hypothetical protein